MSDVPRGFNPSVITRPDARLMTYYFVLALLSLPAFPITLLALWIRFRTMRFRFDDEGIWRSQGILWRREVNVAYRRIQDIHLTSGIIQRWLGLATVSIQTAAGSASPEVSIEGVLEAEALRDYLYSKMRGVHDGGVANAANLVSPVNPVNPSNLVNPVDDEALALLTEIRDALRRVEARLGEPGAGV